MDPTQTLALATMTGLLYGTPGPAVLSLAAAGGSFGVRRSLPYLAGILIGLATNLAIAALGLAVLFTRYPALGSAFRIASVAYVFYLAFKLMRPTLDAGGEPRPPRFVDGLVLNVINPKAYMAALMVLAAFADTRASDGRTLVWTICVAFGVGVVIDVAWLSAGALLARARTSGRTPRGWNAVFATSLVVSVLVSVYWI